MSQPRGRDREPPQDLFRESNPFLDSCYGIISSNRDVRPRRRYIEMTLRTSELRHLSLMGA